VKTKVEELPESRVRIEVEVPEADVQHAFEHAASDLADSLRIPGFRKGKAPPQIVAARVGREALWQEALRSHLDGWFWSAAETSGIRPVANPEVEVPEEMPDGGPFTFTATVSVLPRPEVADWTALEVPSASPDVPPELVDFELERVREGVAELAPVEGRAAQAGDTVVLDIEGEGIPSQIDYVAAVGEGRLLEEIDEALVGMASGETKPVEIPLDEERSSEIKVTVKELKEKVLPAFDDELARTASEFETLEELREDIAARLHDQLAEELEIEFREAAIDALVEASQVETAPSLVERRMAELWVGLVRSLERRGVSAETYLTMTGQSQEQVLGRLQAEADRSLKRELLLDAVADKLAIQASDEEIEELVREQADEMGEEPDEIAQRLRQSGNLEKIRADLRLRKALDQVVAGVKRIPVDLAKAREKLWTPEKEKGGSGMKIWTPGSKETQ
jgi:trigger factor